MMSKLNVEGFTVLEMGYIKEYCKVNKPIALALDMLQGEAQAYFGTLLPTISGAKQKLQHMIDARGELTHCKDLAKALLAGLTKRFEHLESDEKCNLATAFHPIFRRLGWLREDKRENLKKKMQDLIAAHLKKTVEESALTSAVDTDNGDAGTSAEMEVTGAVPAPYLELWQSLSETPTARARRDIYDVNAANIVKAWTKTPTEPLPTWSLQESDFQREQSLIDLFIEYNTPVPSSAGVERLFNQGGDILRPKRSTLTAEGFNELMFMRGNRHHWETYKEG
jgi:hypothetical protein